MNRRTISQAVASTLMVIFGLFGQWSIHEYGLLFGPMDSSRSIPTFIFSAFTIVMGVWGLILASLKVRDEEQEDPRFLTAYANAWRKMSQGFWLYALAAALSLVNFLGTAVECGLSWRYIGDRTSQLASGPFSQAVEQPFHLPATVYMLHSLPNEIGLAVSSLFPRIDSSQSNASGFVAVALLLALPWIHGRLKTLRERPEYASEARLLIALILPVGLVALLSAVSNFYSLWYRYAVLSRLHLLPTHGMFMLLVPGMASCLVANVVGGALTGGLAGSLARMSGHEAVTVESFFTDAVKFFKPMVGLFLLIDAVCWFIQGQPYYLMLFSSGVFVIAQLATHFWSLVYVALMFAPFAIAAGIRSVRGGLIGSLRVWLNCGYNLLAFTALGLSGLAVVHMLKSLIPRAISGYPLQIAFALPIAILSAFSTVFIAVAVWEFYQQILAFSAEESEA